MEMDQETAGLLQWFKQPGDRVVAGEPLMEIETDKVTVQIEATADGVLADVRFAAGDEVPSASSSREFAGRRDLLGDG